MPLKFRQKILYLTEKKQMQDKVFFDTNVLIYCYSIDEKEKQKIALELVERLNDYIGQ